MATGSRLALALWIVVLAITTACDSTTEPAARRGDRSPPVVSRTDPPAEAQGVSTQQGVAVTFNEPIDVTTVTPGHFRVLVLGQTLPGSIVGDGRRFTFLPVDSLPGNRRVEVQIRQVADIYGNPLAEDYRFAFHTEGDNPLPPHPPSFPQPESGAADTAIDPVLTWVGGADSGHPITYDVWLGSGANDLTERAAGLPEARYQAGPLPYATVQTWRVVAHSVGGDTYGPLWSFTTRPNPDPDNLSPVEPCAPEPPDGALAQPADVTLDWECGEDPDGDPVNFEIYLGTSPDPPSVARVRRPPFTPDEPLAPGTIYHWRIVADDGRGGMSSSPTWVFHTEPDTPPNDPPTAPEPIAPADGATTTDVSVLLTWSAGDDPDGDPVTYEVRLGTTSPPPPLTNVVNAKLLLIEDLAHSTSYFWQIVARDDHQHESAGPIWTFRTPDSLPPNDPPTAPCDPWPANGATDVPVEVTLTWSCGEDPDGDPVQYVVFLERDDGSDPDSVATVTEKSYAASLDNHAIYHWRIEARDGRGGRATSPTWVFLTEPVVGPNRPPSPPRAPITPPDGSVTSRTSAILTWSGGDDPDGDPVTFDVRFGSTAPPSFLTSVTSKQHLVEGLVYSTEYFWQIVARDDHQHAVEGPVWHFFTPEAPPNLPPSAPCNPVPVNGATGVPVQVTLTWGCGDDPDGDPVEYVVFLAEDDGSDPDSVAAVSEKSYWTELDYGAVYHWRIEARDGRGGNVSSPIWVFESVALSPQNQAPSVPCDPTPDDGRRNVSSNPNLKWKCGEDPDGDPVIYSVFLGKTEVPDFLASTTEREYRVRGLEEEETYYWRIVAEDDHEHATTGPVWSFTTR